MIDAKELRIGNWLKLGKEYTQVYQIIWTRNIGYSVNHKDYFEEIYEPIPLTTEILEKCGFKYGTTGEDEDKVEFWDLKTPDHKHSFGSFYFSIVKWYKGEFTFSHQSIRSDCKYVHQLQNLYYALTQTELEIKL